MLATTINIQSTLFFLISCVVASYGNDVNGLVRRVVEGTRVTIMCRMPIDDQLSQATDPSAVPSMPVIWLKFDIKDPSNRMVISHGDMLLIDDPRLSVTFEENTGKSVLTIDQVQNQDGGSYQCQMPSEPENVSSPPIEVIVEKPAESQSVPMNAINVPLLVALNLIHCTVKLFHF